MRDIREDLQERLDAIGRDREELKRRITDLDTIELAIQAIYKREIESFTAPLSPRTERGFKSFGAKDDAGIFNAKEAVNGFDGQDSAVNYAQNEFVGGVKASHWGEFKVG
jgi:hypothetical protein